MTKVIKDPLTRYAGISLLGMFLVFGSVDNIETQSINPLPLLLGLFATCFGLLRYVRIACKRTEDQLSVQLSYCKASEARDEPTVPVEQSMSTFFNQKFGSVDKVFDDLGSCLNGHRQPAITFTDQPTTPKFFDQEKLPKWGQR